jgi:hypothetical protein
MSGLQPGQIWPQDRWGRVLNAAMARDALPVQIVSAAERAADLCLERFGEELHSVYLSGPAARGRPGGATFLALLRLSGTHLDLGSWSIAAASELRRQLPNLGPVAMAVFRWRDVFPADGRFAAPRFRLATNSLCVAGRDAARLIAPQPLSVAAANPSVLALKARLSQAAKRLKAASTTARVRAASADAGRAVLAAGFGLVLLDEQVWTEDLDRRRDFFLLNRPERKADIERAYQMATRPPAAALEGLAFIEQAAGWLVPECEAWLDMFNPAREGALPTS